VVILNLCSENEKRLSFLQNPVGFAEALAVFRPTAYKTAFFRGSSEGRALCPGALKKTAKSVHDEP
jgi:hypothetical protein